MIRITTSICSLLALSSLTLAQAQTTEDEAKELLKNNFFYYDAGRATDWVITGGTASEGSGKALFHPQTGSSVRIQTTRERSTLTQIIQAADHPAEIAVGNELQGLIHYKLFKKTTRGGALRLHMAWLNAEGQEITATDEVAFINAPEAWIAYYDVTPDVYFDAWHTLQFRTTVPEGATQFRFSVEVAEDTDIALDDFSLVQAKGGTAFTSIIPQLILPLHGRLGERLSTRFVAQTYPLGKGYQAEVIGASDFSADVPLLGEKSRSQAFNLVFAPTKAGRLPLKASDRVSLGLSAVGSQGGAQTDRPTVSLRAYAIDPANPPKIEVDQTSLNFRGEVGGKNIDQFLQISGDQLIDEVKIQIEPNGQGFLLSSSQIYYFPEARQGSGGVSFKQGINPTKYRVSFRPQSAGTREATLVLSSTDAETVRIPLRAVVSSADQGRWIESFVTEQKVEDKYNRYAHLGERGLPEDTHYFKHGLWQVEDPEALLFAAQDEEAPNKKHLLLLAPNKAVTFLGSFTPGLYASNDFPQGIKEVKLRADSYSSSNSLALEVSYDGGGSWSRIPTAPTVTKRVGYHELVFAVESTRQTLFRFLRTDSPESDPVGILAVEVVANETAQSPVESDLTKLVDFSADKALTKLDEHFEGRPHHTALLAQGWRNFSAGANRGFVYGDFRSGALDTPIETSAAKISYTGYKAQPGGASEFSTYLISPLLDYKGAKTKELTFRFLRQNPLEGDALRVSLAIVREGKIQSLQQIPLEQLFPFEEVKKNQWYNVFLDLNKLTEQNESLRSLEQFALVFEHRVQSLDNTSAAFWIDDVTFGREDNTRLSCEVKGLNFFSLLSNQASNIQSAEIKVTNPHDQITASTVGTRYKTFFLSRQSDASDTRVNAPDYDADRYQKLSLPAEGGTIYVYAKSKEVKAKDQFIASLFVQAPSAEGLELHLFATPKTRQQILDEEAERNRPKVTPNEDASPSAVGYAFRQGSQLVIIAPELLTYEAYSLTGSLLSKGASSGNRLELPLPQDGHLVIKLLYRDGRSQVIRY